AGHHLVATEGPELIGDDAGGALDVEADLGMRVEVLAPERDFVLHGSDAIDNGHSSSPAATKRGRQPSGWRTKRKTPGAMPAARASRAENRAEAGIDFTPDCRCPIFPDRQGSADASAHCAGGSLQAMRSDAMGYLRKSIAGIAAAA